MQAHKVGNSSLLKGIHPRRGHDRIQRMISRQRQTATRKYLFKGSVRRQVNSVLRRQWQFGRNAWQSREIFIGQSVLAHIDAMSYALR